MFLLGTPLTMRYCETPPRSASARRAAVSMMASIVVDSEGCAALSASSEPACCAAVPRPSQELQLQSASLERVPLLERLERMYAKDEHREFERLYAKDELHDCFIHNSARFDEAYIPSSAAEFEGSSLAADIDPFLSQADVREEHLYVGEFDAELSLERH